MRFGRAALHPRPSRHGAAEKSSTTALHTEDVADAVAAETSVVADLQLVLPPGLHAGELHELLLARSRICVVVLHRQELKAGHVGVRHLGGVAQRPEVDAEVALRGPIDALDVWPHTRYNGSPDSSLGALGADEVGQLGVRPLEHAGDRLTDGGIGDVGGELAGLDFRGELLPVVLEEADGPEEAVGEHSADAERAKDGAPHRRG
ncbi:hypothetical protein HU200_056801 [Digitaria exilis]|uniref:Uncharacterized protein n=1 Tax=Digitaria exilis TaxID=1010633 RepID=A0A835ALZ3_9POAL|nr:hypothetical protein HU200_056801 [Digitaria exilis]